MHQPVTAEDPEVVALERPFRLESWRIDPLANEITEEDRTVRIEPKAMLLLACLAGRAERPVTREALTEAIWPEVTVGEDSLSRLVFQLRRAFGDDPQHPRFIQTLPKVGYRLAVAARPIEPARQAAAPRPTADVERVKSPSSSFLLMAVLGGIFSCGWWSGRRAARRHRGATERPMANRSL